MMKIELALQARNEIGSEDENWSLWPSEHEWRKQ